MQGAAHRPGANDGLLCDGSLDLRLDRLLHAQSDRPQGAEVVLSLNRPEPRYDLGRAPKGRSGDVLVMEAQMWNIESSHWVIVSVRMPVHGGEHLTDGALQPDERRPGGDVVTDVEFLYGANLGNGADVSVGQTVAGGDQHPQIARALCHGRDAQQLFSHLRRFARVRRVGQVGIARGADLDLL